MKKLYLVAGVFVAFAATMLAGQTWSEPVKIGQIEDSYFDGPVLFLDNQGLPWCEVNPWFYQYNSETGEWNEKTASNGRVLRGGVCFDKTDTMWVIIYGVGSLPLISYMYYNGQWSEDDIPGTGAMVSPYCFKITPDSTQGTWLFFDEQEQTGVFWQQYQFGSWSSPEEWMEYQHTRVLASTTDHEGKVWLAFAGKPYPQQAVTLYTRYFDGLIWREYKTLDEGLHEYLGWSNDDPMMVDLAPDRNGGMWAVWERRPSDLDSFDICARYWDGEGWGDTDTLAREATNPQVAVDEWGTAWAVWVQHDNIYYSRNPGSGWSTPAPVADMPYHDLYPDIEAAADGKVWCVWRNPTFSDDAVWASYTEAGGGIAETYPDRLIEVDRTVGSCFTFRISSTWGDATVDIYNIEGRKICEMDICDDVTWDGTDRSNSLLPPGVYFAGIQAPDFPDSRVQKLILVR